VVRIRGRRVKKYRMYVEDVFALEVIILDFVNQNIKYILQFRDENDHFILLCANNSFMLFSCLAITTKNKIILLIIDIIKKKIYVYIYIYIYYF